MCFRRLVVTFVSFSFIVLALCCFRPAANQKKDLESQDDSHSIVDQKKGKKKIGLMEKKHLKPMSLKYRLDIECERCGYSPNSKYEGSEYEYEEGQYKKGTDFANTYLSSKTPCQYAPFKVIDGNPKTAWVEGVEGQGVGAELIPPRLLDTNTPVKIWAGYGKSRKLFRLNSRPKRIEVAIIRSKSEWSGPFEHTGGCDESYSSLKIVARHKLTLKDVNAYQKLPLPKFELETYSDFSGGYYMMEVGERQAYEESLKKGKPLYEKSTLNYLYFLKIKILSVYPGTKYSDTAISEIIN